MKYFSGIIFKNKKYSSRVLNSKTYLQMLYFPQIINERSKCALIIKELNKNPLVENELLNMNIDLLKYEY